MEAARPDDSREPQENLAGAKGLPDRPALDRDALSSTEFLSANGIPQLTVVDTTGSTNADLLRAVTVDPKAWPDLAVLTAEHQTAGRCPPRPTRGSHSWPRWRFATRCWTPRESRPSSNGRTTSWSAAGRSPASLPSSG